MSEQQHRHVFVSGRHIVDCAICGEGLDNVQHESAS